MADIYTLMCDCQALQWDDNVKGIRRCERKTSNIHSAICDDCRAKGRGKTINDLSDWDLKMFDLDRQMRMLKGETGPIYICGKDGCTLG